jgi:hypothetical protein
LSPTHPLNAPVASWAAFDSAVPIRAWVWGSILRKWPGPVFVVLACAPPLGLVLQGWPKAERQLAPEVPLALAIKTGLHNPCARAAAAGLGPNESLVGSVAV